MDAYKAIISKRDQREYDARLIPDETVRCILQAGRMAGSSSNRQLCRLIVLNDRNQESGSEENLSLRSSLLLTPSFPLQSPTSNIPLPASSLHPSFCSCRILFRAES